MRTSPFTKALLVALVAGPLALMGCERTTQTEIESDGSVETETELEPAVDAPDVEAALDSTGAAIERGAEAAGEAIEGAAQDVHDAVDSNVDLGENAENQ